MTTDLSIKSNQKINETDIDELEFLPSGLLDIDDFLNDWDYEKFSCNVISSLTFGSLDVTSFISQKNITPFKVPELKRQMNSKFESTETDLEAVQLVQTSQTVLPKYRPLERIPRTNLSREVFIKSHSSKKISNTVQQVLAPPGFPLKSEPDIQKLSRPPGF